MLIHGDYTPAIGMVHGVALAASGVLLVFEHRETRAQRERPARRDSAQLD